MTAQDREAASMQARDHFGLLTDEERHELGEVIGQIVTYFSEAAWTARRERDEAVREAERLQVIVDRYRHDGPRVTDQADYEAVA